MKKYYIVVDNTKLGPYSLSELKEIAITKETLVWTSELENWEKAERFDELLEFINNTPPPIPKARTHENELEEKPIVNNKIKSVAANEIKSVVRIILVCFFIAIASFPVVYFGIYDANRYDDGRIQIKDGTIAGVDREDILSGLMNFNDIMSPGKEWAIQNRKDKIMELSFNKSLIVFVVSLILMLSIRYISKGTNWVNKHSK